MSSRISLVSSAQIDADRYIIKAHQMRSEYIAQAFKTGLSFLRNLVSRKSIPKTAPA